MVKPLDRNDFLMLAGAVLLLVGVYLLSLPAALILAGLFLVAYGAYRDVT